MRRLLLPCHVASEIGTIAYDTDLGRKVMPVSDEVRQDRGASLALNSFPLVPPKLHVGLPLPASILDQRGTQVLRIHGTFPAGVIRRA